MTLAAASLLDLEDSVRQSQRVLFRNGAFGAEVQHLSVDFLWLS